MQTGTESNGNHTLYRKLVEKEWDRWKIWEKTLNWDEYKFRGYFWENRCQKDCKADMWNFSFFYLASFHLFFARFQFFAWSSYGRARYCIQAEERSHNSAMQRFHAYLIWLCVTGINRHRLCIFVGGNFKVRSTPKKKQNKKNWFVINLMSFEFQIYIFLFNVDFYIWDFRINKSDAFEMRWRENRFYHFVF